MFLDKFKNNLTYKKAAQKVVRHSSSLVYKLFRYCVLIGAAYVVLFPLFKMITASFTDAYELYSNNSGFIPNDPTYENYKHFYTYFKFDDYLLRTCEVAFGATALQLVSCSLVGYGLGRYKFKGSSLVFVAVLFTIILPTQISLIPQFYNYRWFDLFGIGKIIGLFTGTTVTVNLHNIRNMPMFIPAMFAMGLRSGVFIFLFKQFFASMPRDLEEAAKLDGCGPFSTYLRVMVPNIKPVVVTTVLLSVIYYWNDTMTSSLMLKTEHGETLMVRMEFMYETSNAFYKLSDQAQKLAEECCMALVVVAPLIVLFLIGQRFFVECMDRSGSKG